MVQVPAKHGVDDSHLNVVVKPRRDAERKPDSLPVGDGEAALGYLRSFASSVVFEDAAAYGSGDAAQVPAGAELRRSARTKSAPEMLRMPATMKGGARLWREHLAEEDAGPAEASHPKVVAAKRGSGSVKARAASKRSLSMEECAGRRSCARRHGRPWMSGEQFVPGLDGRQSWRGACQAGHARAY